MRPRVIGPRLQFGAARGGTNRVSIASWCFGYPLTQSHRGFGGILAVVPQIMRPAQGGFELARDGDERAVRAKLAASWPVETGGREAVWIVRPFGGRR